MAKKKVTVTEGCVLTKDDKGKLSIVGNAKEALNTLSKNNIDVTIFLFSIKKDEAEKFLKENDVKYKNLEDVEDVKQKGFDKSDAYVMGEDNILILNSRFGNSWRGIFDDLTQMFYGSRQPEPKTEQQKSDDAWTDYKKWSEKAAKARDANTPVMM